MPFEEPAVLECFSQVCDAVSFVHGLKMVHRDIKSRNIFLCRTRGYTCGWSFCQFLKFTQLRGNVCTHHILYYDELQGRGDWLTGLGMQLPICPGFNGCVRRIRRTGRALLGDFGLVRLLESTCDLAHTRVGTPYYLSPEPLGHLGTWALGLGMGMVELLQSGQTMPYCCGAGVELHLKSTYVNLL